MTTGTRPAAALAAALIVLAGTGTPVPAGTPLVVADAQGAAVSDGAVVVLDESSAGGTQAAVGSRLEVRLKAQFGTGFSWALSRDTETVLKPAGDGILPAAAGQAPEGGFETQVFSFEAVAPGEAQLEFTYRRPWLPNDPTNKHLTFTVTVTAK